MEVLQRTANRGSISDGGYAIANSLLLENSDNDKNFNHQQIYTGGDDQWTAKANEGTNTKKATISMWIKRSRLSPSSGDGQHMRLFQFQTGGNATALYLTLDKINMYDDVTSAYLISNRLLRDTSAWYHIVLAMDSTQSTAANRVKIYVNGVQETSWSTEDYGNQNADLAMFSTANVTWYLGCAGSQNGGYALDGYMAEVHFVDGAQKAASDFGEFDDSGIWKPKEYTDSYGTLGAYYNFEDTSNNRFNDESGNGNYMDNRGGVFEGGIATDTPTNNFCTWNVLPLYNSTIFSFPNGATEVKRTSGTGWTTAYSSIGANKGKWYAEFQVLTSGNYLMNGNVPLAKIQSVSATQFYLGSEASAAAGAGYYSSGTTGNDYIYHDGGATESGVVTSAGDIISVAMDCDNNKIHFAVNGSYTNSSNPATNTNGFNMTDDYQFFAHATLTGDQVFKNNFGGFTTISISSAASDANGYGTFEYAPPSGFYALNTKNLAEYG